MSVRRAPPKVVPLEAPAYHPRAAGPFKQLTIDDLTPSERCVAALGVSPDELKPIGWLNAMHHKKMLDGQLLHPDLAKGIEGFKRMSAAEAKAGVGP